MALTLNPNPNPNPNPYPYPYPNPNPNPNLNPEPDQVGSLEQAVFSVVQYPFALKLLWAPLVDSVYSRAVGRRLSWILPVQPAIGALMLHASGRVEAMLGSSSPDVKALAGIFLALYLLAATQVNLTLPLT